MRSHFIANAAYWIREFHFDELRVDATQNIYDSDPSHEHLLVHITHAAREAAEKRSCSSWRKRAATRSSHQIATRRRVRHGCI